jgi:hypothetical protein
MEFRHGLIANYREYWNPTAFTAAMTGTRFEKSADRNEALYFPVSTCALWKCERQLCQNCVTYPPQPRANTVIYGHTSRHIDVAGSR